MGADSPWACSAAPLQTDGARIRQDRPRGSWIHDRRRASCRPAPAALLLIWINARGRPARQMLQ